jgi:hypothetical protein
MRVASLCTKRAVNVGFFMLEAVSTYIDFILSSFAQKKKETAIDAPVEIINSGRSINMIRSDCPSCRIKRQSLSL